MALDEQKENDQVFTEKGVTFIIEKELFDRAQPISIDYVHSTLGSGYKIKSELMKREASSNVTVFANIVEVVHS